MHQVAVVERDLEKQRRGQRDLQQGEGHAVDDAADERRLLVRVEQRQQPREGGQTRLPAAVHVTHDHGELLRGDDLVAAHAQLPVAVGVAQDLHELARLVHGHEDVHVPLVPAAQVLQLVHRAAGPEQGAALDAGAAPERPVRQEDVARSEVELRVGVAGRADGRQLEGGELGEVEEGGHAVGGQGLHGAVHGVVLGRAGPEAEEVACTKPRNACMFCDKLGTRGF